MKVLTAQQMQAVDRRTIDEVGIPGIVLMENAGRAAAEEIVARFDGATGYALILAGRGNNGGDGSVVARCLLGRGWRTKLILLAERERVVGDASIALRAYEACGGDVYCAPDEAALKVALDASGEPDLLVDALFGTGLTRAVEGSARLAIDWMNDHEAPVVALDIPSGVDASSGRLTGPAVRADLTVTFAFPKVGQLSHPGAGLSGELVIAEIGVPAHVAEEAPSDCLLVDAMEAERLLPHRRQDGHKGTFGHLLVLAGSVGKCGAAVMSSEAGLRSGAGLVTLGCPVSVLPSAAARLTEVMTVPLADFGGEISMQALGQASGLLDDKQAFAIGPGFGLGKEAATLIRRMLEGAELPVVVDADALTALDGHLEVLAGRACREIVLTPHPGEMARLTGLSIEEIQADRFRVARDFATQHRLVLVLKGARTLTACPDGRVFINSTGHAGLASGGMGDVLTGLIGGFLAQGLDAVSAAVLGVYLHGLAADRLRPVHGDAGLIATDVIREIPAARKALSEEE